MFSVFVFSSLVFAAEFRIHHGAKLDKKASKEANEAAAKMPGTKAAIYTTADSFQKVASFYNGIAKEYAMPRAYGTSGKPKDTKTTLYMRRFFIFDGAKDLSSSKLWVKVQRPYIGEDVRDVTAIVVTRKSS